MTRRKSTTKGFSRAITLMQTRIRKAGESRGFSVSRVLTHWPEVVGEDLAAQCRPVKVGYGRGGLGATLTVLTRGAMAPMLDMQRERIREKVNACYGYNAIAKVVITQTAPTGFAEGQASFAPARKPAPKGPDPKFTDRAKAAAEGIQDDRLRAMIELLGANVMTKHTSNRRP